MRDERHHRRQHHDGGKMANALEKAFQAECSQSRIGSLDAAGCNHIAATASSPIIMVMALHHAAMPIVMSMALVSVLCKDRRRADTAAEGKPCSTKGSNHKAFQSAFITHLLWYQAVAHCATSNMSHLKQKASCAQPNISEKTCSLASYLNV
jgi:hypothetical protein